MNWIRRTSTRAIVAALVVYAAQAATIHGILATGQSLSVGCYGYAAGQVTSGTPYSNKSLSAGTMVLEGPSGATVAAITQASGGVPASPTIASGGSGYGTTPPTVYVVGDGTGGAYTANLTGGSVTSLTRTSAGSGYTAIQIYMTFPVTAASVVQLDTSPLIALAPTFTCNNSSGDPANPSGLPEEYPSLSAVNQLTYLEGGVSGFQYVLGVAGSSGRDYLTIGGPTDAYATWFANGVKSTPFLPSPNPSFTDSMTQLAAMNTAVTGGGNTFQLDAVMLTHGENDEIEYNRLYGTNLATFQSDYQTQANALIGRSGTLPMFTDQQQAWGGYHGSGAVPIAAIGQWQAAENNVGKIFLIGPYYYVPASGSDSLGVHKPPAGYRQMGELAGKAIDWVLNKGSYWLPVMPKSIAISGATITAKFFTPVGSLALDTSAVAMQTNYGFEFTDGLTAWIDRIHQASGSAPANPTIFSGGSGYGSAPTVTVNGCAGAAYIANLTGGVVTGLTQTSAGSGCTTIDILFSAPTPSVSISSVTVTRSDTLQIVLSGTPTGPNPTLRYAYTAPSATGGGLGNLRDTDPTAGRTGSNLSDWCVTFSAALPFRSKLYGKMFSATGGVVGPLQ